MNVKRYAHGEGDFWQRMGPFLASAQVRRELGVAITSDEKTVWWLAIDGSDILGFCAARVQGDVCHLRHDYVVPGARGNGIYRALFSARLEGCQGMGKVMRATVSKNSLPQYLGSGFVATGTRGQYTIVERGVTHGSV